MILADCLDVLRTMLENSVDVAITDPPYNVGKAYNSHDDSMPEDEYVAWMQDVYRELGRVCDSVVFFPGTRRFLQTNEFLAKSDLSVRRILGWHKREFAGDLWSGGPAMCWEPVVWAATSESPYYNKIFGTWGRDFFVVDATHGDEARAVHPCPKPLLVMRWLVNLFCPEDGTVLDPFMGTGRTGVACVIQSRGFVGIEKDPVYFAYAERQIDAVAAQGVLL